MSNCKYYNDKNKDLGTYVSSKTLDKNNQLIYDYKNYPCFSHITYHSINSKVSKIVVYRPLKQIPYDIEVIKLWINELNELGFPCNCELDNNNKEVVNFTINIADFKYKPHLSCTLMLIRCLFEDGICFVPEFYFSLIKKHKNPDKFSILQDAHKKIKGMGLGANTNHMVTFLSDGYEGNNEINVTREQLFKNIENTKIGIYDGEKTCIWRLWKGIDKDKKIS